MNRMIGSPCFRRGAAAVEFAVCAPVLFMLIFGIVEFSRALQLQQSVRQAAFEAARAGVTLDATATDPVTSATANLAAIGVNDATVTVSPSPLTYNSPTVTVAVSVKPATTGWLLRFFNSTSTITSTITLVREVQAISVPASGSSGSTSSGSTSSGSTSGSTSTSGSGSSSGGWGGWGGGGWW